MRCWSATAARTGFATRPAHPTAWPDGASVGAAGRPLASRATPMTSGVLGGLVGPAATTARVVAVLGGGHASVLDPVAQAATTTSSAGPAAFNLSGSVTANGKRIPLNGEGTVDLEAQRARMSVS